MPKTRIILWNDYSGEDAGKEYALALAGKSAGCVAIQAKGLKDLVERLKGLKKSDNQITQLIIATHGQNSSFQISTPTASGVEWVSLNDLKETSPEDFIIAIDPYLEPTASIVLLACAVALNGDRSEFMRQLSYHDGNYSVRPVYACTGTVFFSRDGDTYKVTTAGSVLYLKPGELNPKLKKLNTNRANRLDVEIPNYTETQSLFPQFETGFTFAMSNEPMLLNGMKVIFDQPVGVYPVTLESKVEERRNGN